MLEGAAEDAQRAEGEAQVQGDRDARETMGENTYRANLAQKCGRALPGSTPGRHAPGAHSGLLASCMGAAEAGLAVLGVSAVTHLLRNYPL